MTLKEKLLHGPSEKDNADSLQRRPKSALKTKRVRFKDKTKTQNKPGGGLYDGLVIKTPPPEKLLRMLEQKPDSLPAVREFFDLIYQREYDKVKKMLKENSVDVNSRDVDDPLFPTPLLVATQLNDGELVKILLKAKPKPANVNDENIRGRRPIWWAAKFANEYITDLLVNGKQKCEVNELDKETGCAPLYQAILSNSAEVCQLLIRAGANINLKRMSFTAETETPLIKAVMLNNKDICEVLINNLCKMHTKTETGMNALHYAAAMCRYEICGLLLESGMKVHSKSNSGVTAMTISIEMHNPVLVRTLLKFGYKMDKKYKWKETPLQQAIKTHSWECAMTLIHFGCNIKRDKTPSYFHMAVDEKLVRVAKFLAELNPLFLNESWIRQQKWPLSIYRRPDILEWLMEESKQPQSLKRLCRGKIYHYLGRYAILKVPELTLPEPMKEYLTLKDHVKDKFYKEIPIEKKECPFDCPVVCSMKRCAPIELSTSDSEDESSSDEEVKKDDKIYCEICQDRHSPHEHENTALHLTTRRLSSRQIVT